MQPVSIALVNNLPTYRVTIKSKVTQETMNITMRSSEEYIIAKVDILKKENLNKIKRTFYGYGKLVKSSE